MLPNSVAFFEVWLAAAKLNASVVLVQRAPEGQTRSAYIVTRTSEAKVLVDDVDLVDTLIAEGAEHAGERQVELAPVVTLGAARLLHVGHDGRPKGVIHGRFTGEVARMSQDGQVALWSWTPDDVYVMAGPSYHAAHGGWASTALYVGATGATARVGRARMAGPGRAPPATRSFLVPAHFIRILEVPDEERARASTSPACASSCTRRRRARWR